MCTDSSTAAPSGSGGSCPYSKDNLSWAEYQVTIPMGSSVTSAAIVLTFDAETTIVFTYEIFSRNLIKSFILREVVTAVVLPLALNVQVLFVRLPILEVHSSCSM